jgi:hypothetical protein
MKNTEKTNLQSTQLKFYKVVAVPMMTYTSENWIINQPDKNKIESVEMRLLCPVAGSTLLDPK